MPRFIEIHNSLINIESISKVDFISDDIYLDLIPRDEEGNTIIDFIPFTFGQVELFTGQKIDLEIDLYYLEEGETVEAWAKRNRSYINLSWDKLINSLGEITKITGYEYEL